MKIGAMIPDRRDSTSVYRGVGPLAALRKMYDVHTEYLKEVSWHALRDCDVFFAQRPCNDQHLAAIKMAIDNRIPVWVDFDDDLTAIPEWSPTSMHYAALGPNTVAAAAMADLVTVSTRKLTEVYRSKPGGQVFIVPNAIDTDWLPVPKVKPTKRGHKLVAWRGSSTHRWDLNLLWPAVQDIEAKRDDVRFCFFSDNPPWFIEFMKYESEFIPWMEYPRYMSALANMAPDVVVVPLYDCPLNRAKSNVAALEAIWAGAYVVAPNWEEWNGNFIFHYADPSEIAKGVIDCFVCNGVDRSTLPDSRHLSVQATYRYNILTNLMESR